MDQNPLTPTYIPGLCTDSASPNYELFFDDFIDESSTQEDVKRDNFSEDISIIQEEMKKVLDHLADEIKKVERSRRPPSV